MKQTHCLFWLTLSILLVLAVPGNAYQESFDNSGSPQSTPIVTYGLPNDSFELSNTDNMNLLIADTLNIEESPSVLLPTITPDSSPLLSFAIQEEALLIPILQELPGTPYHPGAFPHIDAKTAAIVQAPVPEPSTLVLLSLGVLGLFGIARKRKQL